MNRKDRATALSAFDSSLGMAEMLRKEKQWKSANLEKATWKFRL
jgi:hypothetical protein